MKPDDTRFEQCQECMPRECGRVRRYTGFFPRIYGGERVQRGSHPWMAMLIDYESREILIGSGVLISCNLVLTTAYNMEKIRNFESLRIRLGSVNVHEYADGEMEFSASRVILHPEWDPAKNVFANDLALIKLNGRVDFAATNGFIEPICLPAKYRDFSGWLTVAGFGQNFENTNRGELREADIYKLSRPECKLFVGAPYSFCGLGNNKGLCNGDRGSPAIQAEQDGRFSLVALANDYQCWPGGSDVYTEVSPFMKWICSVNV